MNLYLKNQYLKFEKKEEFVPATTAGYLPLSDHERESKSSPLPEIPVEEPKAGSMELTADGGKIGQEIPVKKKLSERLKLKEKLSNLRNLRLPKLEQIKAVSLKNLKPRLLTNKLSSNLSQLKENLSWKNLTNWNKSPTLSLLKKLLPPKR